MKSLLLTLFLLTSILGGLKAQDYGIELEHSFRNSSVWSLQVKSLGTYKFDYPKAALDNHISGRVQFTYKLNDSCKMEEVVLVDSLGHGLDEIATDLMTHIQKAFNLQDVKECPIGQTAKMPIKFSY